MDYDFELAAMLFQPRSNNACRGYVIYAMENCVLSPNNIQRLLQDIKLGLIKRVIIYKLDWISRSIVDFAKLMELFKKVFTTASRIMCMTTLVVFTIFLIIRNMRYTIQIGIGLFRTAILQILGNRNQS